MADRTDAGHRVDVAYWRSAWFEANRRADHAESALTEIRRIAESGWASDGRALNAIRTVLAEDQCETATAPPPPKWETALRKFMNTPGASVDVVQDIIDVIRAALAEESESDKNDAVWGKGQWIRCEACPHVGGAAATHHRDFHRAALAEEPERG